MTWTDPPPGRANPGRTEAPGASSPALSAADAGDRREVVHATQTVSPEAAEAARLGERLEAMERQAGILSHELNNISMGILGFAHLLLGAIDEVDPRRPDVLAIAELTQRAVAVTARMIAFARGQEPVPPAAQAQRAVADVERPLARAPVTTGHETILVAEDDDSVREVVGRSLRARGFQVIEARNGGEALHILQKGTKVDVVISDLVMPVLGGLELGFALRALNPTIPLLLMSGHADDHEALLDLGRSQIPFLQKPFRPDALVRRVRELLDEACRAHV